MFKATNDSGRLERGDLSPLYLLADLSASDAYSAGTYCKRTGLRVRRRQVASEKRRQVAALQICRGLLTQEKAERGLLPLPV